jgi:hypothetical protein
MFFAYFIFVRIQPEGEIICEIHYSLYRFIIYLDEIKSDWIYRQNTLLKWQNHMLYKQ